MNASALYSYYSSPFGELLLTSDGESLTGLHLPRHDGSPAPLPEPDSGWRRDDRALGDAREQLRAYFGGDRLAFDLPIAWPARRSSASRGTGC